MTGRPIRLFSYGTLQLDTVQLEIFGRRLSGASDALPGHSRKMVRITDPAVLAVSSADHHPIIAASGDRDDSVEGMVFEITAAELAAADAYEVSDYRRVEVVLASGLRAWVYVQG